MDRDDRRLAGLELETALLQFPLEELGVGPQLLDQFFAFGRVQQGERRLAGCGNGWGMRRRKQERPSPQIEVVDQVARPADVTAHRANGLTQSPHLNVHTAVAVEVIYRPASSSPQDTRGVGVV